ncbi:hypothetical protein TNCV_4672021 [Trichonephila clavipes]|nr:hypothetical protein TNCV_4672021 [Trichonephila clavipes]
MEIRYRLQHLFLKFIIEQKQFLQGSGSKEGNKKPKKYHLEDFKRMASATRQRTLQRLILMATGGVSGAWWNSPTTILLHSLDQDKIDLFMNKNKGSGEEDMY